MIPLRYVQIWTIFGPFSDRARKGHDTFRYAPTPNSQIRYDTMCYKTRDTGTHRQPGSQGAVSAAALDLQIRVRYFQIPAMIHRDSVQIPVMQGYICIYYICIYVYIARCFVIRRDTGRVLQRCESTDMIMIRRDTS